jgi:hypothetical protein
MSLILVVILSTGFGWLTLALIQRVRQPEFRRAAVILALLAVIPVLALLGGFSAHVINNWRLDQFAAQLCEYPLPASAIEIGRQAEVGVLAGNGDHCDFVARGEIASQLPLEAVRAHYTGPQLDPAISRGASGGLPAVEVEPREGGRYVVTW